MKFKFCSDGDCPLWVLAALNALSTLPPPLFRSLLQCVLDDGPDDGVMDLLKDTNLSSREEAARVCAALRWVLCQSWRGAGAGGVGADDLTRDLLLLGVPRALAAALAEAAEEHREAYVAAVTENSFMVNKITDVSVTPGPEGSIDAYKLTIHTDNPLTAEQNRKELLMEKSQLKSMLEELKKAYKKMEELEKE